MDEAFLPERNSLSSGKGKIENQSALHSALRTIKGIPLEDIGVAWCCICSLGLQREV